MKQLMPIALFLLVLCTVPAAMAAETMQGEIELISYGTKTLVVKGITFHATEGTLYRGKYQGEELESFDGLERNQRVEIIFHFSDGAHYIEEIAIDNDEPL